MFMQPLGADDDAAPPVVDEDELAPLEFVDEVDEDWVSLLLAEITKKYYK